MAAGFTFLAAAGAVVAPAVPAALAVAPPAVLTAGASVAVAVAVAAVVFASVNFEASTVEAVPNPKSSHKPIASHFAVSS